MDDEKKLQDQVEMSVAASAAMGLNQTVWVYRGSMWAYPWLENTRKTLDDPAYADWYIKFKPEGPYYSSKCDNNYNPPKCSDYYHNQEQSPGESLTKSCPFQEQRLFFFTFILVTYDAISSSN